MSVVKMFRILVVMVVATVIFYPVNTNAEIKYQQVSLEQLKDISGDWYTPKGKLAISIHDNQLTIGKETYPIISLGYTGDTVGFYEITTDMGNDEYGSLEVISTGSYKGVHKILVLTKKNYGLRDTVNARYVESISGVYLGMDKDQLVKLLGEPTSKTTRGQDECWIYKSNGLEVCFDQWAKNIICSIKIYPNSNCKFDRSGLSSKSSHDEFAAKYKTKVTARGGLDIGDGELIRIGDDGVTLTLFTPGYVF